MALAAQAYISYLAAECLPELKTEKPSILGFTIETDSKEVIEVRSAQRKGCPVGKGQTESCKHTAAVFMLSMTF